MTKIKKSIIFLFFVLIFANSVYSLDDGDVRLTYGLSEITITIDGSASDTYFNRLQFYNDYSVGEQIPPTPDGLISVNTICNEDCTGKKDITFKLIDVKIMQPGVYYLVVHDLGEEERNIIKQFYISAQDLSGCDFNGVFVPGNTCVEEITGSEEDRKFYCDNGDIVENFCGICGCVEGEVCCPNPDYDECSNNIGICVVPAEAIIEDTIPPEIIESVEPEEIIEIQGEAFCDVIIDFEQYEIPINECVNQRIQTLSSDNPFFSNYCYCEELNYDLDNDGFDSLGYGGNDCDDNNPNIHPGASEICGNNADEDCDGRFNNGCSGICDTDGDNYDEFFWCLGPNLKDDCNDNDPEVFLGNLEICDLKDNNCNGEVDEGLEGNEEICGNLVDDNCDGQIDEGCVCEVDKIEIIDGLCADGLRKCESGRIWETITEPNNGIDVNGRKECPLVTYINEEEKGFIEINKEDVIKITTTYVCTNSEGCSNVRARFI